MNVVSRGIKNTLRSPLRSGAIILMLAISIGLILSMLVARSSVESKIIEVKSNAGTSITISPAGVMGFEGGGNALTSDQVASIKSTAHVSSVTTSLRDQLSTSDTSLTPSLEFGNFGQRSRDQESSSSSGLDNSSSSSNNSSSYSTDPSNSNRPTPTPKVTITGASDPDTVSTSGSSITISSGSTINGNSSELIALVGIDLATKNNLNVGSTFTAYGKTINVVGIFTTDNKFQDSGIIMPILTLQTLTDQSGAVSSIIAKVDSSDNVSSTVTALKSTIGDKADIVSDVERANTSTTSLGSISSLALAGVIGAAIAGAAIILLAMIIIIRERRHEIGVIKAIGGTNFKVITQFVTEALTLTVTGAVIGLALGVAASGPMTTTLVSNGASSSSSSSSAKGPGGRPGGMMRESLDQMGSNLKSITASLSPQVFASAVGITFLIAILGSALPAWFIARIRPAEVLRTE